MLDPVWDDAYLEREARTGGLPPVLHARIAACLGVDRVAEAEADLQRYEALRRRWPIRILPPALAWMRGQLAEARGEWDEAEAAYATQLADPALPDFPFLQAQVLHSSGRLRHRAGNRRAAVDHLVRARDGFTALRAVPYLDRCNADLVACGLPARSADPLVLTPREEDVLTLVLRGSSNKQAAAELFLTVKTVEHHLRNVYAKMGVESRHELRRLRGRR